MDRFFSTVYYVFICLVCDTVTALGQEYARIENTVLGHVFESNIAGTAINCCLACSQLPRCAAVNYFRDTGRCELNEKNPLDYPSSALVLNVTAGVDVYHRHGEKCDDSWVLFDRHCYWFSDKYNTWKRSRKDCRKMAAELVDIHDETEDAFVRETAIEKGEAMWIGLGKYHTVLPRTWTNGQLVTYTNFADGEPSYYDGWGELEDCIGIHQKQYKWNDFDCSWNKNAFICKKRLY